MILLAACFVPYPEDLPIQYDTLGLPDCDASYSDQQLCDSLTPWTSYEVSGFNDAAINNQAVRWIGTEVQPAFCTDDMAEAEGWVVEREPDADGTHTAWAADARWWDFRRYDAEGTFYRQDRVMRCDFATAEAPTPPGADSVPAFMQLTDAAAEDPGAFFPMVRDIVRWRRVDELTVQVVLSWGEAEVESEHGRVCAVRCGDCSDQIGPTRNATAILESQDWVYTPDDGAVSFGVEAVREVDCQLKF